MEEAQKFRANNGVEVTLRVAIPSDAGGILKTIKSTAPERSFVLMEQYGKNAESERDYILGLDPEENLLLVAIMEGEVVGSLGALQADEGQNPQTGHILRVGLHLGQPYRGLGIGARMLLYTSEWAREHGFKKLEASIFTTNQRSLHLFSRAGFQEEGTRRKRFWVGNDYVDEVLMGKILD